MQELGNIFFSPLLLILLFFHLANIDFPLPPACLQKTGRRVSMPQSRPCRWARCYRPLCHPRRKQSSLRWDPGVHSGLCLVPTQSLLGSCFADVRGRSGAGGTVRGKGREKRRNKATAPLIINWVSDVRGGEPITTLNFTCCSFLSAIVVTLGVRFACIHLERAQGGGINKYIYGRSEGVDS